MWLDVRDLTPETTGLAFDKPELAATATTTSHQSQYTSIVAQEVAGSSMLCQELDAIQTPQELPAEPFSRGSDTEYLSESKARHKSRDCISSPDEKVDLNVSQDFDNQSTVERPVSRNEPRSWSVTVAGPDFTKLVDEKGPRLNDQTIDCANPALSPDTSCQWPGLQDDAGIIDTVPTRDLVEDLRHVFMLIHIEWIFKLLSSPELYVSCPSMSSETAFDLGLRTLLQFIQGELPRTLQSTFTLMEITIACAYTLYEDRDMSLWEDLFESVLGWQYAISDTIERAIFVRSMKYLMGHQHYKGVMSYPSKDIIPSQRLPAADRSQYEREVLHIMTPAVHNPTAAELSQEPQMYIEDSLLWSQLGKGRAMNLCWEFLEDIAYAELLLRSVSPLQATTLYSPRHMDIIVDLETFIIAQLRSYREMIVLEDVIDSTELQIYNGLLRDPREVEVALLYYCKQHMPRWSSMKTQPGQPNNSSQAREACRQIISHVCNQRMTAAGWRNRHRANDMRVVLAIAREQERDQCPVSLPTYEDAVKDQFNSATASSPLSEVQLDPDLYDPTPESSKGKARGSYTLIQPNDPMPPTSVSQVQDFASLHEADGPTPSTSFSQAPYYATLNQAEGSTPPTFVGQAQVSPTVTEPDHTPPPTFDGTFLPTPPSSQGSPRSATQMIRCRYCHRMHTKGNLSRHIKRIHEDPKTWSCHVSTCTSTFTRKDAVNKHIGKVHGGVSLQRQGAKRLKK
ncbi:uncharacterized protein KY384_002984 [Bacidia gigantensis]|uniref:uncharacterized protein n=1 Tax=Bacidia gigantensis TaxID=2732470 RepID=UPI001D045218|nr:uncharacterized protein KY384_002984 [Bacidia gigantensis]KAG8531355.1 hypothetical protein KY384_002984 [Bacidia gigantensis]